MSVHRPRLAAYWAYGLLVATSGCNSPEQRYALEVKKGSYSNGFSQDTATILEVTNSESQSVTIDRLLVNGEYQVTKRWETIKPVACTFPLTIDAGKTEQFFVSGKKGERDRGGFPLPPLVLPSLGPKADEILAKQRRAREEKRQQEEEARRRQEEDLWTGHEQPMRFAEVVTDRGSQKFNFK